MSPCDGKGKEDNCKCLDMFVVHMSYLESGPEGFSNFESSSSS